MAGGIPTAEQEALQAPTLDPIWFGALATKMGPFAALKSLAGAAANSALGGKHPQLWSLPAPSMGALEPILMSAFQKLLPKGITAAEAVKDTPDFWTLLGGRGPVKVGPDATDVMDPIEVQTMDNLHRLLRYMYGSK